MKVVSPKDQWTITSLGTEFALTEILGAAVGYWLDKKWGTLPWGIVGGVLVGFAWGLARVVQSAKIATKNTEQVKKDGRS